MRGTRASRAVACLLAVAGAAQARQLSQHHESALAGEPIRTNITNKADAEEGAAQKVFGNYGQLNSQIPVQTHVNCHFGPQYYDRASNSQASKEYLKMIRYYMGDNYEPVTKEGDDNPEHKTKHDEAWAPGLVFSGKCLLKDNNLPTCAFIFGPFSRATGTTWIRNPKPDQIKFVDCAVGLDDTLVNSTTCFQEADLTRINIEAGYKEQSISAITFYSRFRDESPDGPPATYNLAYRCQFLFNSFENFNPATNDVGLDPRITSWIPNLPGGGNGVGAGGQVGPPGNGGYSGPGQLPGLKGGPEQAGNVDPLMEPLKQQANGVGSSSRQQSG